MVSQCFVLALSLLASGTTADSGSVLHLTVTNPAAVEQRGEIVAVPWADILAALPSLDTSRVIVLAVPDTVKLLTQRTGEELLFMADFPPGASRRFIVTEGEPETGTPPGPVDGRFVLPREDYAWENDRIAFRVYGPAQKDKVANGIDVWTKRVRYPIVGKWYRESEGSPPGQDTYHVDRGEGADFFSVGKTLGAGGSAIWRDTRLFQPGVFTTWKTIAKGPLRISFELTYDSVNVLGTVYREHRRITLDAGRHLNRVDVTYHGPAGELDLDIACGLVKRDGTTASRSNRECWLSLWGQTNDDAENGSLGTGIVLPESRWRGMAEDSLHYLIVGRIGTGQTMTYYAGAGWTRSGDFDTADDWERYLSEFVRKIRSPLLVTMEKGAAR